MAFDGPAVLDWSFEASADLSGSQFLFVKLTDAGKVAACSAVTDKPIGVLQNKPTSGQMASVRIIGITKLIADATIDEDDVIGTSADGQAQPLTEGTETTVYMVGRPLTPAAAGETFSAVINCVAPAKAA